MMSAIVAGLSATVELTFRGNFLRNAVTLVHCGCGLCRAVCKNNKSRHDISGQPSKTFNNHTHLSDGHAVTFGNGPSRVSLALICLSLTNKPPSQ